MYIDKWPIEKKQTLEGSRVKDDYLNVQLFDEDNETLFIDKAIPVEH